MCGISGVFRFDGDPINREELVAFTRALAHRGPDGEGFEFFDLAALGHRRLSIIDLETGQEPLCNEDGSVWLTYNGEVYNFRELRRELESKGHRFRTNTDAEVIVHGYEEWGVRCVERLTGMFAFGLWDAARKRLFLARDRLGIKPLVYWARPDAIYFASELQAFSALDSPPEGIEPRALDHFLELLYVPAPLTIFSGVRKLLPGHILTVDRGGRIEETRYWEPRFASGAEDGAALDEEEWVERIDAALGEALRSHLISDVPLGSFLSSGLDSGLVTSMMARESSEPLRTFTIRIDDPGYDESAPARDLAGALGARHREASLNVGDWRLPDLLARFGEPFADPSIVPMFAVSRLAAQDVKVVLSGDGGDEVFGGYTWLTAALNAFVLPSTDARTRAKRVIRQMLGWLPGTRALSDPLSVFDRAVSCFDAPSRRALWRPEWREKAARPAVIEQSRAALDGLDLCSQIQWLDLAWDLPGDILEKVDIASMTFGLEVRPPLLDHRLVELCLRLPLSLKYRFENGNLVSRVAERLVARRHVPESVLSAPKKGFGFPLQHWWSAGRQGEMASRIERGVSPLLEFFDPARLRAVTGRDGRRDLRIWALDVLEAWLLRGDRASVGSAAGLQASIR